MSAWPLMRPESAEEKKFWIWEIEEKKTNTFPNNRFQTIDAKASKPDPRR
jgi:hypothetical protein